MSSKISPLPIPSFYHWKFNLPEASYHSQWRGVYYPSGITRQHRRQIVLDAQKRVDAAKSRLENQRRVALSNTRRGNPLVQILQAHSVGLVDVAAPHLETLCSSGNISSMDFALLMKSLTSPEVQRCVYETTGFYDPMQTLKMTAEYAGEQRAHAALELFDVCASQHKMEAMHFNALMSVLLTCGYTHSQRVCDSIWDRMGHQHVNPTALTYELVMTALGLGTRIHEADAILQFLRSRAPSQLHTGLWNVMLMAARQGREYEQCDILWTEMLQQQGSSLPPPDVLTADQYLRSIIDLSYTPTSESAHEYGELNIVEKKRIPGVLRQMEVAGIAKLSLTPPVLTEVEDALRKFSIPKHRFYNWGRAIYLFNFVKYRRRYGWLNDIEEAQPPVVRGMSMRPANPDGLGIAPRLTATLPLHHGLRPIWERPPLEDLLNVHRVDERMEEVRGGNKFNLVQTPIHKRPSNWMNEVPQTRYDKLYGITNPQVAKLGIRRYLSVGDQTEKDEVLARDAQLVKNAIASGRRVRKRVESSRTHRHTS